MDTWRFWDGDRVTGIIYNGGMNDNQTAICIDPACSGAAGPPHQHLSMPNPCRHFTRLELIAARLNDPEFADYILNAGCDHHDADLDDDADYLMRHGN